MYTYIYIYIYNEEPRSASAVDHRGTAGLARLAPPLGRARHGPLHGPVVAAVPWLIITIITIIIIITIIMIMMISIIGLILTVIQITMIRIGGSARGRSAS